MTRAVLSLGANLGDRLAALQHAVDTVCADEQVRGVAVSPVYETAPVGGPEQPDYLNAVLVVDTSGEPRELLELAHRAESGLGRTREVRWGPRTLDVDVIGFDDVVSDDPVLTLPHPRAAERAFVLLPWAAADPDARLTGNGRVADLLAGVDSTGVRLRADLRLLLPAGGTS